MQCINKIKAGFTRTGDLTFKPRQADPGIVGFELECRKCLPCRLNIAREKAIRAVHEAECHKKNIFLTLTYAPGKLKSPRLNYGDFQLFMKRLRELHTRDVLDPDLKKEMSISYMVTGEYGDKNKRPHWHAIIFNYSPPDLMLHRTDQNDYQIFKSKIIDELWGFNDPENCPNEIGSVTIESAGYVARYAAKKLTHGQDQEHDFHPVHKTSCVNAVGKRWIEKHYQQVFKLGYVWLPNGGRTKIPRYYVDWLKKNHPEEHKNYVTKIRHKLQLAAAEKSRNEEIQYLTELMNLPHGYPMPESKKKMSLTILKQKFKKLQEKLKL
ncbi:replication initiator protein [Apis mellifera associated microvirus 27]|nr:replication initiator protein [Apis mellifera associated microvirus 27]